MIENVNDDELPDEQNEEKRFDRYKFFGGIGKRYILSISLNYLKTLYLLSYFFVSFKNTKHFTWITRTYW